MLIALYDAEQERIKNKTFPNFALMKISAYHKTLGDDVVWWKWNRTRLIDDEQITLSGETAGEEFTRELNEYNSQFDKIYSSKVFDFTPENPNLPKHTIKGGTGYGLFEELPQEIDCCFPDYSIYQKCDYAIGFLTRGCINNCSFCIVPKKEGNIKPYSKWQDIVKPDTKKLVLMDNNILACQYGIEQLNELSETDYLIDLNQGMDVTLLTDEVMKVLSKLKWIEYIRFSCDKEYQLPYFENAIDLFKKYKMPVSKIFIYTLIQKDLENADRRIQKLQSICKSFNIYAQSERNSFLGIEPNKAQLEFAQRYVYGRSYKNENWNKYCKRHGYCF